MGQGVAAGLVTRRDGTLPGVLPLPDNRRHDVERGVDPEPVEKRHAPAEGLEHVEKER